ncbi:MAG: hypothetical protein CM15mP70_00610 [Pelagibacteraceae bacterium]|nr:MAG: hypothetical protein CM15mP70_00610 [Pelagibacteraceae bacterium]
MYNFGEAIANYEKLDKWKVSPMKSLHRKELSMLIVTVQIGK